VGGHDDRFYLLAPLFAAREDALEPRCFFFRRVFHALVGDADGDQAGGEGVGVAVAVGFEAGGAGGRALSG